MMFERVDEETMKIEILHNQKMTSIKKQIMKMGSQVLKIQEMLKVPLSMIMKNLQAKLVMLGEKL